MYFPYLHGRQGEIKAIEELAGYSGVPQKIVPILEPVSKNASYILNLVEKFERKKSEIYIIVNPSQGDLKDSSTLLHWTAAVEATLSSPAVRPTIEIRRATTQADLLDFVTKYSGAKIGVSIRAAHLSPTSIALAFANQTVTYFTHGSADPVQFSTTLGNANCVEVRDSFRAADRNADYAGAEPFTTSHLNFPADGRQGFSDYTLLPGKFKPGGGPMGAAVIHMTFEEKKTGALWVQHFVSKETRQYQSSSTEKLMDAMTQLENDRQSNPNKYVISFGLASFYSQFVRRAPTNGTYNKMQQISHHLYTVAQLL